MDASLQHHDVIVIGGSAGGVAALRTLAASLPADLPAAVFVAIHMGLGTVSHLPEVISRAGPLPATHAIHGEEIARGRIYVAPPDMHLIVRPGYMNVVRGPKENGQRPSVDTMFRSAATVYGPRVLGVVLSGYLDCGTSGLLSITARGGRAVVQDPVDAEVPDMPRSAVQHAPVDHVLPIASIGAVIKKLVCEPAVEAAPVGYKLGALQQFEGVEPGRPIDIVCPSCQGSLTEAQLGDFKLFRCHVGHAFSQQSMIDEQAQSLEHALWAASRALEESAAFAGRMARMSTDRLRARFEEKQATQAQQALLVRRMLEQGNLRDAYQAPSVGVQHGPRDSVNES